MKTIKSGYSGNEVKILSDSMKSNGLSADSNSTFTESMKQSVIKFQKENGLDADGIVGYKTWEKLLLKGHETNQKLTENDFKLVSMLLDCEIAAVKVVQKVETGGRGGFFAPGKPAILFEGHIFWQQLKKRRIDPEKYVQGKSNILYPKWEKGHYKGGLGEYDRLEQARKINYEAADASASWGMFQIMGFNYAACDEKSVENFVRSMQESESEQLILFARFIHRNKILLEALQNKNWNTFAKHYNGLDYEKNNYHRKLKEAYDGFSRC